MSTRILDISGINPKTGKSWYGTREIVVPEWGNTRVEVRWVNHQANEDTPTNGIGTCLHWTADRHNVVYNDYMVNGIFGADGKAYLVKTIRWNQRQAHLWKRNSIIDGWTACADPTVKGREPKLEVVDLLAQWNAEYLCWKKIDPRAKIKIPEMACNRSADTAWFTGETIEVPTIWHHAGFAQRDGYGAHRWDCNWKLPGARGLTMFEFYNKKSLEYYDALKAGKRKFEFVEALKT